MHPNVYDFAFGFCLFVCFPLWFDRVVVQQIATKGESALDDALLTSHYWELQNLTISIIYHSYNRVVIEFHY